MSNTKTKKTVMITENELVDLIDNIVNEAVTEKKKSWIAEQAKKKATVLEGKVANLEAKIKILFESKN
jgi:hypothetical protein